jgi:hypothetical protein
METHILCQDDCCVQPIALRDNNKNFAKYKLLFLKTAVHWIISALSLNACTIKFNQMEPSNKAHIKHMIYFNRNCVATRWQ